MQKSKVPRYKECRMNKTQCRRRGSTEVYEATIRPSEGRQAMRPFLDAYLVDPEVRPGH